MTAGRTAASLCICVLLCATPLCADLGLQFVRSPEPIIAPPGDEVVFECSVNVPAEQLRWCHAGHFVHHNHCGLEGSSNHSKSSSQLVFRVQDDTQAGDYQCVAWFGASALTSVPAKLSLAELHAFPEQRDEIFKVLTGNTVALRCDMPYSNPPATLQYYKNSIKLPGSVDVLATTGTLILQNVTSQESGTYTCSATNYITGQTFFASHTMQLNVINASEKRSPHSLLKPQSNYTVQMGRNVTLECSAVGNPVPKVTWHKFGGTLPRGRAHIIPGGLMLQFVMRGDEGSYVCEISNGIKPAYNHIAMVHLQEPPIVVKEPKNSVVEEGSEVQLECLAKGLPEPEITWLLNGESVLNDTHVETKFGKLLINQVEKRHAGIFQCFASNPLGTVYGSSMLQVSPKQVTAQPNSDFLTPAIEEDFNESSNEGINFVTPIPTMGNRGYGKQENTRKGPGRRKDKKHKGNALMIPPTRPNITRLTDTSVMVRWGVPPNTGLPIQFFKVQHREMNRNGRRKEGSRSGGTRNKGSRWKTNNEEIAPHIRSYEVDGLETDHTYRFRIAAVYSNNDNKLGPTSARFHLQRGSSNNRNALSAPILIHTEAVGPTAIQIQWQYTGSSGPVEGFYVYYRDTSSAGDYVKATVDGEKTRSFTVTHLMPDTAYDIKLQSFTIGAASNFSTILTHKTLSVPTEKPAIPEVVRSTDIESSNNQLYVVLGAVLGGLGLLVALFLVLFICNKQRTANNHNSQVANDQQDKFRDPSLQVEPVNVFGLNHKNVLNGCLPQNGYLQHSKVHITSNPLAESDQDKIQNVIEMSFLSSQNNNCSAASEAGGSGTTSNNLSENKVSQPESSGSSTRNEGQSWRATSPQTGENYV